MILCPCQICSLPGFRLLTAFLCFAPVRADAHDVLADYIQRAVTLAVGSNHIDLELELTFFEHPSAAERKAMDTDGDGFISTGERESYLDRLAPIFAGQIRLCVAGKQIPLTPLYEPELSLPGQSALARSHHQLKFILFTTTPADLKAGDAIVIEDRLWPANRILGSVRAEGRDGCRLEADATWTPVMTNHVRIAARAAVKCLRPPRKPANSAATAIPEAARKIVTSEYSSQ
jgi:hypothetical protein